MLDLQKTYKLSEIIKIFDIKRHFIIHLVEKKIIKPLVDAKGRGKSRIYSYRNLVEIGIFIYLNKLEVSYNIAKQILLGIKAHDSDRWEWLSYISIIGFINGEYFLSINIARGPEAITISPGECLALDMEGEVSRKKEDYAYYFILDVKNIVAFINEKISTL